MNKQEASRTISASRRALAKFDSGRPMTPVEIRYLRSCKEAVRFFGRSYKWHKLDEGLLNEALELQSYLEKVYGSGLNEIER